jgi:hypothetical protein
MNQRVKKLARAAFPIAAVAIALVVAALPQRVDAYVLEGPQVLDLTADAMGRLGTLEVNQKLYAYPQITETVPAQPVVDQTSPRPPVPTVFDETAIYMMPERFRSDLVSDRIRRTHLVFGNSALTVLDGRLAVGQDPFDLYQRLLRSRSRPRLMRTLNRMGVETAISSLGRVDQRVVFILGAHYPDESVSQLAVDKDTFLPIRLLLVDADAADDSNRLEIFYRNWQKIQSGQFPYHVLFYLNGRLAREIRVSDIRLHPTIPKDFMDLEALKASVAQREADTPQGQKQETVKAVRQAVDDFQKKFE